MRRLLLSVFAVVLVAGFVATPEASAQQSVSVFLGGFVLSGAESRDGTDVLVANSEFLAFEVDDFNGFTVGGEWLVALGDKFDAGLGVGYYQRTVPTVYREFVNDNGSEIESELNLRVVPFSATIRFLPLGHRARIQPYIGGGVGVFSWRYREGGQFVDPNDLSIFAGTFEGTGTNAGPLVLGGVKFPVGPIDVGGEIRYQSAEGTLPASEGFAGSTIDLGGFDYLVTFNVRF